MLQIFMCIISITFSTVGPGFNSIYLDNSNKAVKLDEKKGQVIKVLVSESNFKRRYFLTGF